MSDVIPARRSAQSIFDGFLLTGLLALVFLLGCFRQKDTDIWWHLKTGQMILDRGELPQKDWFTFTSLERDWIDLHWLFQITAAELYSLGGVELLTAVSATLGAMAVGVLLIARRTGWSVSVAVACWFPVVFLLTGRMYVRPEVVTLVCMAIFLTLLFHAADRPRLLWALVPVQILWVNVQGLFILGIVLAGFYWADGMWRRTWRQPESRLGLRTALLTTLILASLFNPYSFRGLLFPIELFRKMSWDADLLDKFGKGENFYSKHIGELQSIPQFIAEAGVWNFYVLLHFALSALATASFLFIWTRRHFDLFRLLTFAAFAWLGLQATRNSGQFALVAGAVTAWNFSEWFATRRESRTAEEGNLMIEDRGLRIAADTPSRLTTRREPLSSIVYPLILRSALALILIVAAWSVVTGRFYALAGESRLFGLGEHPLWHAHDAARFAAGTGMPNRVLAFHLGHAAVFEFHKRDDQRTFCDPRLEVVSREVLEEYHAIEAAMGQDQPGWQARLDQHNLRMILTDHRAHFAIEATLLLTPEWRCVHFDPVAAVFVRAQTADALQIPAVDFATLSAQTTPDSENRRSPDPTRDPAHREAEALYLVGRAVSERPGTNMRLAYDLLLRAAQLEGRDQPADEKPFEQLRLLGQICYSLSQLPPFTDDPRTQTRPAIPDGDPATESLAQADEWFRKAIALRPDDFMSLIYLYSIAQRLQRVEEQIRLGDQILSRRHARPLERIIRDRIAAELAELRGEKDPASREGRSPDPRSRQK